MSTRVFQFHSGSAVGDAITNGMFYIKDILAERGVASEIFVEHRDPRLANKLHLIEDFRPNPDDLLMIHHSMGHQQMHVLKNLNCRKVLVYHNVTPPHFFVREPFLREYATLGLAQISELLEIVQGTIADSNYNAVELRRRGCDSPVAIPLLRDFIPLRDAPFNPRFHYYEEPRFQLLFVGRICANKGQLHLVRFLERYRDAFTYPLHLTLVGNTGFGDAYAEQLRQTIAAAGLEDRVVLAGHVSDEDLYGHYRAADAYVSYSEHEGFGVPLLEAMAFDVPVVALEKAAIADTLGDTGLRLQTTEPNELAACLRRLFGDRAYRRSIIRGQRKRLTDFSRVRVADQLVAFLQPHLPPDIALREPAGRTATTRGRPAGSVSRQYIIEGPCETSYSLAITNRKLAVSLSKDPGTDAALVPMEGEPGYRLKEDGLQENPEVVPLLEPLPFEPEATVVSFRNMYPLRPAGMIGDLRIAGHSWEESEIPQETARLMNRYLDGVAAPTEFVRRVYRNSGVRVPMGIYGHGVDHWPMAPRRTPRDGGVFTFLHVSSGLARKGIEELLLGYLAAFSKADPVKLIIKTHPNITNIVLKWFDQLWSNRPHAPLVDIIFDDLSADKLRALYERSDAVVLPTRGEGFNYPAAEALVNGVPLIVTGHSGHMDFCADAHTFLLDYDFELNLSHHGSSQAMWVRARAGDVASKMREVFELHHDASVQHKTDLSQKVAASMTWQRTSEKLQNFVSRLEKSRAQREKLKIAWVSTWKTRCGIAKYSEMFVDNLPRQFVEIDIFTNHWAGVDSVSTKAVQNWTDRSGNLDQVVADAKSRNVDAVVFQYNYGFHTLKDLGKAVIDLRNAQIDSYVFFHKTEPASVHEEIESIGDHADAFKAATRLVVHSVSDVNRLKSFGLVDNVVKFPHGALRPIAIDNKVNQRLLGLDKSAPIIGSFGFLVPHKGIMELILAAAMLSRRHPNLLLLLSNALNPDPVSDLEHAACKRLITSLGLDDNVLMINEFLEDHEAQLLMQACDVVVFPYRETGESSSAAVRAGLSSLRPVLTTPLPIFDNVRTIVHQSKGTSAPDLAEAIQQLLDDPGLRDRLTAGQAEWVRQHDWTAIGERLVNMMIGLFEDEHEATVVGGDDEDADPAVPGAPKDGDAAVAEIGDEAFVRMAYQRLLGRDAEPEGLKVQLDALGSGRVGRQDLLEILASSPEGRRYAGESGRPVEPAKPIASTRPVMPAEPAKQDEAGRPDIETISFAQLDRGDDLSFVQGTYFALLKRIPDDNDASNSLSSLENGMDRRDFVQMILSSEEFSIAGRPIRFVWDTPAHSSVN